MATVLIPIGNPFVFSLTDVGASLTAASLTVTNLSGTTVLGPTSATPSANAAQWSLAGLGAAGIYTGTVTFTDGALTGLHAVYTINYGNVATSPTSPLLFASTLGPQVVGVGTWRGRLLRSLVELGTPIGYDPTTGAASSTLLPGVFNDDDLDAALRAALVPLSNYRPSKRVLSSLAITAGQSLYTLPLDFDEPDPKSWHSLVGLDAFASGRYPGSHFSWMRYQDQADSPITRNSSRGYGYGAGGTGYGFLGFGGGGFGDFGALYASNGDLAAGGSHRHGAQFFGPDLDNPTPYLLLNPTPTGTPAYPLTNLLYKSSHKIYRLTANQSNNGYATNLDGTLTKTLPPSYAPFNPATDVLSFMDSDIEMVLSLLYAKYWLLSEKILASADRGDSVSYSFYSQATGQSRKDIQKQADIALELFQARTSKVPKGRRC